MTLHITKNILAASISKALSVLFVCLLGFPLVAAPAQSQSKSKGKLTGGEISKMEANAIARASQPIGEVAAASRVAASPSAPFAEASQERAALSRTISAHLDGASVEEALRRIAKEANLEFAYLRRDISVGKAVTLDAKQVSTGKVLREVMRGTGLRVFHLPGTGLIWVKRLDGKVRSAALELKPMRLQSRALVPLGSQVQTGTITGTVTSGGTGDPIPGVNVVVEGTELGAATGADGTYTISGVEPGTYTVTASFVGYGDEAEEGVEVQEGETTVVDITMQREAAGLDEVVVIGYGEQQRRDLTGSVSSVTAAEISSQPTTRLAEALQGRAPGVKVTRSSGAPGGGIKIRIRGANSLRAGNDPLVIIDGFVGGDLSSINPRDIASMNVLKDASATAIYGSRGANGVVIIETKQGQEGKPRVNFEAFWNSKQVEQMDLLSPARYAELVNERDRATGSTLTFSQEELAEIQRSGGTNWQDEIFRPGLTQNYVLSATGGNETSRYYVSGDFANEKGVLANTNYKKYGIQGNVNSVVSDYLDLSVNLSGSQQQHHNTDNLGQYVQGPLSSALVWPSTVPVYDEDGEYMVGASYGPETSPFPHPVFLAQEENDDDVITTLRATGTADVQLLENLTLTGSGSVRYRGVSGNSFDRYPPGGNISSAGASVNDRNATDWQHNERLTYDRFFNDSHHLKASAIFEQQFHSVRNHSASASDFPTLTLGYSGLGLGGTQNAGSGLSQWSLQSYVGRVNYTLLDRYLLTGTVRVDGSSRFSQENRYGTFPSGAAAWRLSEEPFMQPVSWLDDLKLRLSWGITGSQAIGPYATLPRLSTNQGASFDTQSETIGIGPNNPANPDLTWEETTQRNAGVDFGVLNNRISLTADYYVKNTRDLLLQVSVPEYSGYSSILRNLGHVSNRGFEFSLFAAPIQREDINWEATLNFSRNRNKVIELGDPSVDGERVFGGDFLRGQGIGPTFVIEEGKSLGQFYGLIYDGVWQQDEAEEAARYGSKPGDARYRDLNNNGNYDDLTVIGNSNPDYTWGLSSNFTYSNLTLSVLVSGVQGKQILRPLRSFMIGQVAAVENGTSTEILDRWSPENPDGQLPGFSNTSLLVPQSSLFVEDGSYIRLRNVTLSYRVPASWLEGITRSAQVYVGAKDLFTFTDYKGFDPEVNSAGGSDVNEGIDMGAYPHARSFTLGVDVTF